MPDQTASSVVEAVTNEWLLVYGPPKRILTDQGTNFCSNLFLNMCLAWRIDKVRTTSYHPSGNGMCERVNQTIKHGLQKVVNENNLDEWDEAIPQIVFAYNTAVHSATGYSPYFLMFGSLARLPIELRVLPPGDLKKEKSTIWEQQQKIAGVFENVRKNLDTAHEASKDAYDLGSTKRIFKIGDQVRIKLNKIGTKMNKLKAPWSIPYTIVQIRGPVLELQDPESPDDTFNIHSDKVILLTPNLRVEHNTNPDVVEPRSHNRVVNTNPEKEPRTNNVEPINEAPIDVVDNPLKFLFKPRAEGKRVPHITTDFCDFSASFIAMEQAAGVEKRNAYPPSSARNLQQHYGVRDQRIGVIIGIGASFIHQRTGTLYWWDFDQQAFINSANDVYTAPIGAHMSENNETGIFDQFERIDCTLELPTDQIFLNDELRALGGFRGRHQLPQESIYRANQAGWTLSQEGVWMRPSSRQSANAPFDFSTSSAAFSIPSTTSTPPGRFTPTHNGQPSDTKLALSFGNYPSWWVNALSASGPDGCIRSNG